ncbi:MAG: type II secretion system protein [Rubrivivax sp.]
MSPHRGPRTAGFTYLGLLVAVAIAGGVLAAAGALWSTETRREQEEDLLFAGDQFRAAIGAYWSQAPAGMPHALPRTLDELLDDRRWPTQRRHLRRVFVDPMTRGTDWGLVEGPGGTIAGVFSRSDRAPLKKAGFAAADAGFEQAQRYRDWRFVFSPSAASAAQP